MVGRILGLGLFCLFVLNRRRWRDCLGRSRQACFRQHRGIRRHAAVCHAVAGGGCRRRRACRSGTTPSRTGWPSAVGVDRPASVRRPKKNSASHPRNADGSWAWPLCSPSTPASTSATTTMLTSAPSKRRSPFFSPLSAAVYFRPGALCCTQCIAMRVIFFLPVSLLSGGRRC